VTSWIVQAGAFSSEENARKVRDLLAKTYPNPFLEQYLGLLRVKFGPYRSREDADGARESLASLGLAGIVLPHQ
jgi:cell division septation protein DedD